MSRSQQPKISRKLLRNGKKVTRPQNCIYKHTKSTEKRCKNQLLYNEFLFWFSNNCDLPFEPCGFRERREQGGGGVVSLDENLSASGNLFSTMLIFYVCKQYGCDILYRSV